MVVFVGLFIWGFLLGGIGAILAVPMTLLVLIIMENFEGTRSMAILIRYTGEEERGKAGGSKHVKGLWGKVKGTCDQTPMRASRKEADEEQLEG